MRQEEQDPLDAEVTLEGWIYLIEERKGSEGPNPDVHVEDDADDDDVHTSKLWSGEIFCCV
jgi:hypothetical protein